MVGASIGTTNITVVVLAPLFETPVVYASPDPVVGAVFIQNGCPGAEMLKRYFVPLVKEIAGLFWPPITYAPVPEFETAYCTVVADNAGYTILKFEGSLVVNGEYVRRPFDTRTPVLVVDDNVVP